MKSESQTSASSPSVLKAYFLAARPRTWIASLSPVCIGGAIAHSEQPLNFPIFFLTLLFSLLIQIGTNYANDYFDFFKGADTTARKGPQRATQSGWIPPHHVFLATLTIFLTAFLIAIPLMIAAGLWSLPLAVLCIACGLLYTGGPTPFGYLGLGELFVLLFFGPIAACGTYFLQTETLTFPVFIASLAPGFLSCSLLIANNLRDETTDRLANKRTLIVRFGPRFGAYEYTLSILFAALIPLLLIAFFDAPLSLLRATFILLIAIPSIRRVFTFEDPLQLLPVLKDSAILLFFYTALFCWQIN